MNVTRLNHQRIKNQEQNKKKKKNKGYTDHYEDVLPPAKTIIKMMHQMSIKE